MTATVLEVDDEFLAERVHVVDLADSPARGVEHVTPDVEGLHVLERVEGLLRIALQEVRGLDEELVGGAVGVEVEERLREVLPEGTFPGVHDDQEPEQAVALLGVAVFEVVVGQLADQLGGVGQPAVAAHDLSHGEEEFELGRVELDGLVELRFERSSIGSPRQGE